MTPSKSYGQNFLINPKPIVKMIEVAELTDEDVVVEVGSGFGVLTLALAGEVKQVISFEIEKKLKDYWEKITSHKQYDNIEIVWGNVLNNLDKLINKKYKLVANLPYHITSKVIRKFLENIDQPEVMVLMVQKEVAERICAKPGDMSLLSVAVQYYAQPEIVMNVPKTYFWPQPKVDSAIIKLSIKSSERITSTKAKTEQFFSLVKAGFASRRKLLINNLMNWLGKDKKDELLQFFKVIGLTNKARAQELNLEQWKLLVNKL